MPLVLDIETVPLDAAMKEPYPEAERTPPANYKSEEAITKWRDADRVKWETDRAKECSLNPRLGRVLCLGLQVPGSYEYSTCAETEAQEHILLEHFWTMASSQGGEVVTWNGTWDLRFLIVRSLYHRITPKLSASAIRAWFRKYQTFPHFDCKAVLLNWPHSFPANEGIAEWATFLGLKGKTPGLSGADVYPLYLAGAFDEIAEYCGDDVRATAEIYQRIHPLFGDASS